MGFLENIGLHHKIIFVLIMLIFLLVGTPTEAQETCLGRDELIEILNNRFDEHLFSSGLNVDGNVIEVFTSDDRSSWTLVLTMPSGFSCVMSVGESWSLVIPTVDGSL